MSLVRPAAVQRYKPNHGVTRAQLGFFTLRLPASRGVHRACRLACVHQADAASMRPYARPGQRQRSGRSPFARTYDSLISWRMAVWNLSFWLEDG
jgi:hypothetical protein